MKKIRNGRNPRYQEALNLAQENNVLAEKQTDHNFQTVLNLANIDSEIARMGGNLKKLVNNVIPRNDRLTDAYIKLAGRYSDMVNLIRTREDRIDLLERELKNCDPEHWLFAEEDSEDNAAEAEDEPEPDQEFDFGDDFKQYELKTRKPN
tara:strand:- start:876 stop:1325 length:450 start_codon:yes stop_codon:yes gene_type:complete